jgi:hypothetical protein
MARDYAPLFNIEVPLPDCGVELIVSECHNVGQPAVDGVQDPLNAFRAATVLVNLSADPYARVVLRQVQHALRFCRTTAHVVGDGRYAEVLHSCFREHGIDFGAAVVFIDSSTGYSISEVQPMLDSLRDGAGTEAFRVVVVCEEPRRWRALRGVSGYVRGAGVTDANTAALVFVMMAVEMAPVTLSCLDFEDIGFQQDTPEEALVLVQAVWLRGSHQLVWADEVDLQIVRESSSVAAVPLIGEGSLAEVKQIADAVRACIGADASFFYDAPLEFDPASYLHGRIATVPMLCKQEGRR